MKLTRVFLFMSAAIALSGCIGRLAVQQEQATQAVEEAEIATLQAQFGSEPEPAAEAGAIPPDLELITTDSGLQYAITVEGEGELARPGDTVAVHYTGSLLDGTVFDSSLPRGEPFSFTLGAGQVIPGWDEGIALLREGSSAILVIPPELGYGASGFPPAIPPDSTLRFDVELVDIQ